MFCYVNILKLRRLIFLVIFFCFTCIVNAQLPTGYSAVEVQSGYNTIMGVVFNQDGTKMFVWEKRGHVYVSNWDGTTYVKQATPVLDISDEVGDWRDFGFASFCLDPNFDTNGLVYMFYMVDREHLMNFGTPSYDPDDNDYYEASISRVTRYQLNISNSPLTTNYSSRTVLLGESISTGVPLTHESHAGGTIIFANDGTLLVSTGDNASYNSIDDGNASETYYQQAIDDGIMRPEENVGAFRSQMLTSLCGKILRLDPVTGDGLASNPFYEAANPRSPKSRMWSMGLRNPFRMSIQAGSGSTNPNDGNPGIIHIADVGWVTWEDLHIFDKGGLNGGWPLYEGQTVNSNYYNTGATNPDEGNVLFADNCTQPTSFNDSFDPALRRFVHDRPEVAWRHGNSNEARVPWFDGVTPTDPRIGTAQSPTTGIEFRGNAAICGVYIQGDALGSSMNGKYFFTDYVRDWINVATFTDGTMNWISDVSSFAPINFGSGIVHMMQNPLDGFVYYVNIFQGRLDKIIFEGPTWTNEPIGMILECDDVTDFDVAFASWLDSFSGTVSCGVATITNNSSGLSAMCGNTGLETVTFTLSDDCGNQITKEATFTIEDTINPTFNEALPGNTTVDCDSIPVEETLTASDTCGTAIVTFEETTSSGSCSGDSIITRTWTATDDCNNETIHVQTITVEDTINPTFNETLPGNTTVDCDSIPVEETLTASDTCGTAIVTFEETTSSGSCSGDSIITRTWTATDDCNNETIHVQTITVEDTINPTFNETLPGNTTVDCDSIPVEETLTASDTCGTAIVTFEETTSSGSCSGDSIVTRTWTATDDCNNETIHVQTITVEDTINPTFNETLPGNTTVDCDSIPVEETLTASDTCGTAIVTFEETTSSGSCSGDSIVTRTWTATDDCNNETIHVQTITVEDDINPTFNETLPGNTTVDCDSIPVEETLTANDTCGTAIVSFEETTSSGSCSGDSIITRTWTAIDNCNNETIHMQTITVEDTIYPTFNEALPGNTTVDCDSIPVEETLTASDTCGTAIVSFEETTSSGSCSGDSIITRTWTAIDNCNNETIHVQTITVEDTIYPTFNEALPGNTTVDCDSIPIEETLTASDTCGTAIVTFEETTSSGSCSGDSIITRTWTATDDCNNESIHVQTITVEDDINPTFNETLPGNTTVDCDSIPVEETLTASDTCGTAIVSFEETTSSGSCSGDSIITRTWTATDDCNNETIHVQTITVEDTIYPTFNETLPGNTTVDCDSIPVEETLTASDTCGTAIVTFEEITSSGSCSGDSIITRTWTATDLCNNKTIHVQTITVVDTINPIWDNIPSDVTMDCNATVQETYDNWINGFIGSDSCGNASVSHDGPLTVECSETVIVNFTLSDDCGNTNGIAGSFMVEETLNVSDVNTLNNIRMFPNPTYKHIYIKGIIGKGEVEFFNITGQLLLKKQIRNMEIIELDLNTGFYLVRIITDNKQVVKKLIVK